MTERYPYFIYPDVELLRKASAMSEKELEAEGLTPERIRFLRRRVAANVGDIPSLRQMLGLDPAEFAKFYPDLTPTALSTNDTIDTFLAKFGQPEAPVSRATAEIGTDYATSDEDSADNVAAATVEQKAIVDEAGDLPIQSGDYEFEDVEEPGSLLPQDSTASAIDSFLSAKGSQTSNRERSAKSNEAAVKPSKAPETDDDARKYIKNHDYQKALEIIMRLSLNNPEKSVYFADQIRFLRKLILNQSKQNNCNS